MTTGTSPPWVLLSEGDKPIAVLSAMRPGEVFKCDGWTVSQGQAVVDAANLAWANAQMLHEISVLEGQRAEVDAEIAKRKTLVGAKITRAIGLSPANGRRGALSILQRVIAVMASVAPREMDSTQIREALATDGGLPVSPSTVRSSLQRLLGEGQLIRPRHGRYRWPPQTPQSGSV